MTLQAMVKHIEMWLIDKLIPFARNPRTHSETQIAQIAASIAEFGFNNPILVDTAAGISLISIPFFRRTHVSAFAFCMSLFRYSGFAIIIQPQGLVT